MSMPNNLVLVRHGQSEGNVANSRSRRGDNTAFDEEFRRRHSSTWRLTDQGINQAIMAGRWIKAAMPGIMFDRCCVSEYLRALETAYYLGREEEWYPDFYLREREWGVLDVLPVDERLKRFAEEMELRDRSKFYHTPPGGESMASICSNRIDRVLDTLHRECFGRNVLIVCHGEVMDAFVIRLERIHSFDHSDYDQDPKRKIHNGQVIHYSRIDPNNGKQLPYLGWWRSWWPNKPEVLGSINSVNACWQPIKRKKFTNNDLWAVFERQVRQVNS